MNQPKITAIYGSPRRKGNTAQLMNQAVKGAKTCGAEVEEFVLRDLKMSPCLEIYGCKESGDCSIHDDFQIVRDSILKSQGLFIASPIFFYTVSAHTKILMERFQSLWVKKYWINQKSNKEKRICRKGLFIAAGATRGKKLFDGSLLTVKYFFDVLDAELWKAILYRGLDFQDDILKFPSYLEEAFQAGKDLVMSLDTHRT